MQIYSTDCQATEDNQAEYHRYIGHAQSTLPIARFAPSLLTRRALHYSHYICIGKSAKHQGRIGQKQPSAITL